MKKLVIIFSALILASFSLFSQNEDDALRYSFLNFGSTARSMGVGGAFGALGADFSTLSTNPAGIGLYKTSEFTFSPSMFVGKTSSSYMGKTYDDSRYNFNLGNVGLVLSFPTGTQLNSTGWKNIQFGFGINRNNNFNNRITLEGQNFSSSLLDTWVTYADGNNIDNLNAYDVDLGFKTWVLDTIAGQPTKYKAMVPGGGLMQRKSVNTSGSMNEWVVSMGANYDDKLYFGATLGFPFLKYNEESTYSELALASDIGFDNFREFTYHQNLETTGSGFNFKFGMIFKPIDWIRIGAAVHTPTYFYNMHDNYNTTVKSTFDNADTYTEKSPDGSYDYKLNTPMRAIGSLAFIIGKFGLVSADYEFVDYSEARLRSSNGDEFFDQNQAILDKYTTAGNLRVGTEWRVNEFNIRAGYALYDSPFKSGLNDAKRTSYTAGFGIKQASYFLDFAYIYTQSKQDYYLYYADFVPSAYANNKTVTQNFIMTLGFKF
ncbi:MAG: hypothetical protein NTU44_09060 [Bacteroidetes bacterium]|nr:hypothetical protein [Bacteroidota bacterium]